jgi:glycosyltransferase involved in cell wall biosynthesis
LARKSFWLYSAHENVINYGTAFPTDNRAAQEREFFNRFSELRGKRIVLFMGRIHPKKGCDLALQAFAAVLADDPRWHVVMAGPDQVGWKASLESLAERLGIANRITWTGLVSGDLKMGAIRTAEVLFLPSHQENFGIVVAEAMSCGLPVILSNKVNIWREVTAYSAGLICEDTVEGAKASLSGWSRLTYEEIAVFRHSSKKCFDELFNFTATSTKVLNTIEGLARTNHKVGNSLPTVSSDG